MRGKWPANLYYSLHPHPELRHIIKNKPLKVWSIETNQLVLPHSLTQ